MGRRSVSRVAYPAGFATQSAFGTPLDIGDFTKVFNIREGGQSGIEFVYGVDRQKDCTGQYPADEIVLTRLARLTLDLELDDAQLRGLLGWAHGIVGPPIQMLDPSTFEVLLTGLVVGYADGDDPGIRLNNAFVESYSFNGRVNQRLSFTFNFVASGDAPDAVGFTFPECEAITPLRLDSDTQVIIDGTNYSDDEEARGFEFSFSNNPPLTEFPFSLASVDAKRFERGDERPILFRPTISGRPNDTLGNKARQVPRDHVPFQLRIGDTIFDCADAILRPASNFQTFEGEVSEGVLNLELEPTRIAGDASTPIEVQAA